MSMRECLPRDAKRREREREREREKERERVRETEHTSVGEESEAPGP